MTNKGMMEDDLWQLCLQATTAHKKGKFISLFQKAVGLVSPRLGRLLSLSVSPGTGLREGFILSVGGPSSRRFYSPGIDCFESVRG